MKNRLFAASALCVLVLNLVGSTFADVVKNSKKAQTSQLVSLLPASDGVMTLDVKRFFDVALPKLLSGNQPMLREALAKIDEVKTKTGIDIRQFEYVAAGITAKQVNAKNYDTDAVIVARGQINVAALIGAAKLAANGKHKEEKVGDKTIHIFAAKEIAKQNTSPASTPAKSSAVDKIIGRMSAEVAVTALDAKTIAFGAVPLVRQTIEARGKISPELINLLNRKEVSVTNFAAKLPAGMSAFMPLDNDELGKNIDSIRYVFGSMDVVGDNTALNLTAKTVEASQAQGLFETLEGLQLIGKAFLGGSKAADKQVYTRLIENARFSVKGSEVTLDLLVPQSDIDILTAMIK